MRDDEVKSMKSWTKHLVLATKKYEDKENAKAALKARLKKFKRYATTAKKLKKETFEDELMKIEDNIQTILDKELILLKGQKSDDRKINDLRRKIESLEDELIKTKEEDTKVITLLNSELRKFKTQTAKGVEDLKNLIKFFMDRVERGLLTVEVKKELDDLEKAVMDLGDKKLANSLKRQITRLNLKLKGKLGSAVEAEKVAEEISELRAKIIAQYAIKAKELEDSRKKVLSMEEDMHSMQKSMDKIVSSREQKVKDFETKMKSKGLGFTKDGNLVIDDQIKKLEVMHKKLVASKKHDPARLAVIDEKIAALKRKSASNKQAAVMSQLEPISQAPEPKHPFEEFSPAPGELDQAHPIHTPPPEPKDSFNLPSIHETSDVEFSTRPQPNQKAPLDGDLPPPPFPQKKKKKKKGVLGKLFG